MEGEMFPYYSSLDQLARDRRVELMATAHSRRLTRRPKRSRRSRVRAPLPVPVTAGFDSSVCNT
jgi:hypothetical protein